MLSVPFSRVFRVQSRLTLFSSLAQISAHPRKTRARTLHTLLAIDWWANQLRAYGTFFGELNLAGDAAAVLSIAARPPPAAGHGHMAAG